MKAGAFTDREQARVFRRHRVLMSAAVLVAIGTAVTDISVLAAHAGGPSYGEGTALFAYRSGTRTVHGERGGMPVAPRSTAPRSTAPSSSVPTSTTPTTPAPAPTSTPPTSPTTPAPTSSGPTGSGGFTLTHTYTFDGTSVDQSTGNGWAVYDSHYGGNPNARVPGLVTVSGGTLHVTTTGDQGSGLCLCRGAAKPSRPYGRWDIRARAGANADHGFAMLLWPNAENWPAGGEIDIAEFPGADRTKLQSTVHYGQANHQAVTFTKGDFTQWHTYSVVWTSSAVTFLLDGTQIAQVSAPGSVPTGAMHLAMQAGVNTGVKAPSATSATLDVAWVKTYN